MRFYCIWQSYLQVFGVLGMIHIVLDPFVRFIVDHCSHKSRKFRWIASCELVSLAQQPFFDFGPQGLGDVSSRASRALLSAIFKCRANCAGDHRLHVRWRVNKVVVLSSALSDQAREILVDGDVVAHLLPQALECSKNATFEILIFVFLFFFRLFVEEVSNDNYVDELKINSLWIKYNEKANIWWFICSLWEIWIFL